MGVKGLWKIIERCHNKVSPNELAGLRLAVDVSIWIHQFNKVGAKNNLSSSFVLLGFLKRLCKLLFFGIKPVFVFDGSVPLVKQKTIQKRRKIDEEFDYKKAAKKILKGQFGKVQTATREIYIPFEEEKDGEDVDDEIVKFHYSEAKAQKLIESKDEAETFSSTQFQLLSERMKFKNSFSKKEFSRIASKADKVYVLESLVSAAPIEEKKVWLFEDEQEDAPRESFVSLFDEYEKLNNATFNENELNIVNTESINENELKRPVSESESNSSRNENELSNVNNQSMNENENELKNSIDDIELSNLRNESMKDDKLKKSINENELKKSINEDELTHENYEDNFVSVVIESQSQFELNSKNFKENTPIDLEFDRIDEEETPKEDFAPLPAELSSQSITSDIIYDIQQLLFMFGIPYVRSPSEAEAQCAQLERQGLVDGIITDDNDVFLFGGMRVFRNFFKSNLSIEEYKNVKYPRNSLIFIGCCLGSDYSLGIKGFGAVRGKELLELLIENDSQNLKFESSLLKPFAKDILDAFKDHKVIDAYLNPLVESIDMPFEWGQREPDQIIAFLERRLLLSKEKIKNIVSNVIK